MNHTDWLNKHFVEFLKKLNIDNAESYGKLIERYGDNCWQAKFGWKKAGIPFKHGVAIYLLTKVPPYRGKIDNPVAWVVQKYDKLKPFLPEI